ncbi:hypothetical protein MKZ38_008575 [Zalerion maritima]|uniref:60S ribosomal protein L6 n=1 Tax=Zalerion maritima TaxID=339359 RepID=A0AAD5RZL3_9PEZI|nr:hypothetical protein MKZ38_008575 [Zalerion maritima]
MPESTQSKKFGSSSRDVPHHSEKAKKWYPAEDDAERRTVLFMQHCPRRPPSELSVRIFQGQGGSDWELGGRLTRKSVRAWKPRESLQPGTVLILLAGRFRGKRVVLLKNLDQGTLLVTGPFKINGVPLRRVNARYVIATSTKVDVSGLEAKKLDEVSKAKYFTGTKPADKAGEEAFFKQGEKPEKKEISSSRKADQKAIDKVLLANIKKVDMLPSYLKSSFSLQKGDKPHEMKF